MLLVVVFLFFIFLVCWKDIELRSNTMESNLAKYQYIHKKKTLSTYHIQKKKNHCCDTGTILASSLLPYLSGPRG